MQLVKAMLKGWRKEVLIFTISGLLVFLFVYQMKQNSPNKDDSKLKEVQQLVSEIPDFPAFKSAGTTNYKSGYEVVDITKHFNSTADYNEVKDFYSKIFSQRGWTALGEEHVGRSSKQVTFQKGEFSVIVYHVDGDPNRGYNYAIDYVWRDNKQR